MLGATGTAAALAVMPDGSDVFVSINGGTDQVYSLAQAADVLITGTTTAGIAVSGTDLVVAGSGDSQLHIVDLTFTEPDRAVFVGSGPVDVAVSNDGSTAIISNNGSDDVSVVDLTTDEEIARIPVGRLPRGVALRGELAYVVSELASEVAVVHWPSAQRLSCTAGCSLTVPSGPQAVAVNLDGSTVFVGSRGASALSTLVYSP